MMRNKSLSLLLVCLLFFAEFPAFAGIVIGGTRVIFPSNQSDQTISIFNKETHIPYLIQVWVDPFDKKTTTAAPFTAIPPVSRLEPQQEKILRIIKTQGQLPDDRESVFWLNIKNIPPAAQESDRNSMEIAIKTRIKLFWRPASLNISPEKAAPRVKWRHEGRNVIVENPTPIHINIMSVFVDGKEIELNMIKPFEKLILPLPSGVSGQKLSWRFINDYGAVSDPLNQPI